MTVPFTLFVLSVFVVAFFSYGAFLPHLLWCVCTPPLVRFAPIYGAFAPHLVFLWCVSTPPFWCVCTPVRLHPTFLVRLYPTFFVVAFSRGAIIPHIKFCDFDERLCCLAPWTPHVLYVSCGASSAFFARGIHSLPACATPQSSDISVRLPH